MENVKITSFEIENVKKVRTVTYEPTTNGLTVIGGKNGQGKTTILDAISWALGGAKYSPDNPKRDGAALPPHIKITLDNGIIVERKGANSALTVTDPTGARAGQKLLDSFISQLALDLPKFMSSTDKEKAEILLQIMGVGDKLTNLDRQAEQVYNRRHAQGQIALQKKKYAEELPSYEDAPDKPVSAMELIQRNSEILARNGENARKRSHLKKIEMDAQRMQSELHELQEKVKWYQDRLSDKSLEYSRLLEDIDTARKTVEELVDESTDEIQAQIHDIDQINAKVRANMEKERAKEEADNESEKYDILSAELDDIRKARMDLLKNADLPLPNLGIEDGQLTYNGHKWKDISGSEQLIVAVSIIRKLNPKCGFVLMDKLEQMDVDTMHSFGVWLKGEGLQVIATRVSTGDECQIIIEDGLIAPQQQKVTAVDPATKWGKGWGK